MLTKLASVASVLTLCAAGMVAIAPSASACPDPARVIRNGVEVCAGGSTTTPGSPGGGGGGGGGSDLTTGPGNGCGAIAGVGTCPIVPPPAAPPPPQDPTILAEQARDTLQPPVFKIRTSPSPRTYVRLDTGLWLQPADPGGPAGLNVTPAQAGPVNGQTVTATATPRGNAVVWDMVEKRVVCHGPGTPNSTVCKYKYKRSSASQPGGRYRITATITWDIHWQCTGNCPPGQTAGDLAPLTPPATVLMLPVDEIQSVSQPN